MTDTEELRHEEEDEVVDVSELPVVRNGWGANLSLGMVGLIVVEAMVFASLLSSYLYLRIMADTWPPAGVDQPDLVLPTINTAVLLASAWFVRRADVRIRQGDQRWLKGGLSAGLVLALTFLAIKAVELSQKGYRWDEHAYGSLFWTIIGFHTLHVIGLVLKSVAVLVLAFRGYFSSRRRIGVEVNGLYWNFVVAVWIPVYLVLYLGPRLLEGGAR